MKRYLLQLVFFLIVFVTTAQTVTTGPEVRFGGSWIIDGYYPDGENDFENSPSFSYAFGWNVDYNFIKRLGTDLSILFTKKGANNVLFSPDAKYLKYEQLNIYYLSLPVSVHFNATKRFSLGIGAEGAVCVGDNAVDRDFSSFDLSIIGAVHYTIKDFEAGIHYNWNCVPQYSILQVDITKNGYQGRLIQMFTHSLMLSVKWNILRESADLN